MTFLYIAIGVMALIILIAVIALTFLLYQQMLAHNEVNKRMLAITSEAMLSVKITQEEVEQLILSLDRPAKEPGVSKEFEDETNPQFTPHGYRTEE